MAEENTILASGGFKPTTQDTPIDVRTRVATRADIYDIENPYVGMQVYVVDEGKRYTIKSLGDGEIGGVTVPGLKVGEIADSSEEISLEKRMRVDSETGTLYIL